MCPEGFEYLDKNRCVKLITNAADRMTAETECKNLNGNILTSKSGMVQQKIENYLHQKSVTDSIYLGMKMLDGQWTWDDSKATVFASG